MSKLDYLRKDLVETYSYYGGNAPIEVSRTVNGRDVTMHGMSVARTYYGEMHKVWDSDEKKNIYVLTVGCGKQNPFEYPISSETLEERAHESALVDPDLVVKFDKIPVYNDVINLIIVYDTIKDDKAIILTDSEKSKYDELMSPEYHEKYPEDWKYFNLYGCYGS